MCGRFALAATADEIERTFGVQPTQYRPRYNVAPSQEILLIVPDNDRWRPIWCRWGFCRRDGGILINIRSETASEKPFFRRLLDRQRGIVPITGFYEWTGRQPYFITVEGMPLVGLAAVYDDEYDSHTGEGQCRCAILTCPAAPAIAHLHHRMPMIIPPPVYAEWLSTRNNGNGALAAVLHSALPPLHYHAVSTRVGNPAADDASLLKPVEVNQQPLL